MAASTSFAIRIAAGRVAERRASRDESRASRAGIPPKSSTGEAPGRAPEVGPGCRRPGTDRHPVLTDDPALTDDPNIRQ